MGKFFTVKSGHRTPCHLPKKREMILVDVEMQNVKFFREHAHLVEHQHAIGDWVADIAVGLRPTPKGGGRLCSRPPHIR